MSSLHSLICNISLYETVECTTGGKITSIQKRYKIDVGDESDTRYAVEFTETDKYGAMIITHIVFYNDGSKIPFRNLGDGLFFNKKLGEIDVGHDGGAGAIWELWKHMR